MLLGLGSDGCGSGCARMAKLDARGTGLPGEKFALRVKRDGRANGAITRGLRTDLHSRQPLGFAAEEELAFVPRPAPSVPPTRADASRWRDAAKWTGTANACS
jgi:hypothetical protein